MELISFTHCGHFQLLQRLELSGHATALLLLRWVRLFMIKNCLLDACKYVSALHKWTMLMSYYA